jgi:hypothetical protein
MDGLNFQGRYLDGAQMERSGRSRELELLATSCIVLFWDDSTKQEGNRRHKHPDAEYGADIDVFCYLIYSPKFDPIEALWTNQEWSERGIDPSE